MHLEGTRLSGHPTGGREALRLLADASSVLSAALDPDSLFSGVAPLMVPALADFCVIDVVERGVLRRVVAHGLPGCEDLARQTLASSSDPASHPLAESHPMMLAIRTGEVQATPSVLAVPLVARGKTRGAIGLLLGPSGRRHGPQDVVLAEELARRVALAADNLYLYHDARQALRTRDQVLAVVSHDLRNLLNPIAMSAAQLLAGSASGVPGGRPLEVIRRSVDQMDRLIQDLLDVARIEEDRLVLERERLSPATLIDETLESHLSLATQKALRLEGAVAPGLPEIDADHHRLQRVLANLVGNALKFTPSGGRITLGAERSADGGEIRFWVADTGPGIPEENREHLFAPFWQATPQARGGTGLGLSIAKRIVEAHGGRLWVDSTPGEGSVFSFTLACR